MPENRIDLDLTQEQIDNIMVGPKAIEETLPGLIELIPPEQRQGMPRYSDKDLGFILKALSIAEQHPEILPLSFKLDENAPGRGHAAKTRCHPRLDPGYGQV